MKHAMSSYADNSMPVYIDKYLNDEDFVSEMKDMGCEPCPVDENGIFVPITKNDPDNLSKVVETLNQSYGLSTD